MYERRVVKVWTNHCLSCTIRNGWHSATDTVYKTVGTIWALTRDAPAGEATLPTCELPVSRFTVTIRSRSIDIPASHHRSQSSGTRECKAIVSGIDALIFDRVLNRRPYSTVVTSLPGNAACDQPRPPLLTLSQYYVSRVRCKSGVSLRPLSTSIRYCTFEVKSRTRCHDLQHVNPPKYDVLSLARCDPGIRNRC